MALQINNFCGFGTGGGEELGTLSGATISSTNPRTGTYSLLANAANEFGTLPFLGTGLTDQGTDYGICFGFRKNGNPASLANVGGILDDLSSTILSWSLNTSGQLVLINAAATGIDTSSTLTTNQWYWIEMRIGLNADPGNWSWYIDGVNEGSGTSDFTDGNSFATTISSVIRVGTAAVAADVQYDDVILMSGLSSDADLPSQQSGVSSPFGEVFTYQHARAGANTGDTYLSTPGSLSNVAADAGTYDNTDDTPADAGATLDYTAAGVRSGGLHTDHATRGGPKDDTNVDNDASIRAIKTIQNLSRSTGGATTMYIGLGNSGITTGIPDRSVSVATGEATFTTVSESNLPTTSQFITHGAGKSAGTQDLFIHEQWASLLHFPTTPASITLFDHHYKQMRNAG